MEMYYLLTLIVSNLYDTSMTQNMFYLILGF